MSNEIDESDGIAGDAREIIQQIFGRTAACDSRAVAALADELRTTAAKAYARGMERGAEIIDARAKRSRHFAKLNAHSDAGRQFAELAIITEAQADAIRAELARGAANG